MARGADGSRLAGGLDLHLPDGGRAVARAPQDAAAPLAGDFVPVLHGAVFLFPIPLASLLPAERGLVNLTSGWIAVFALEIMLYAVGTAFIVLVLANERTVRLQRDAATSDELTGMLNRRGFLAAAQQLVARQARKGEPVSVLTNVRSRPLHVDQRSLRPRRRERDVAGVRRRRSAARR